MKTGLIKLTILGVTAALLSGCGTTGGIGRLLSQNSTEAGPDEFAILPTKPLTLPDDLTVLPEPDLGGPNRVDPQPEHDAVAALGGQPDRLDSTRIHGGEQTLLAAATRLGTSNNIREVLAKEDKTFREQNGPKLLEKLFRTDSYLRNYEPQTLQARKELLRLRRIGARTPTAPPPEK